LSSLSIRRAGFAITRNQRWDCIEISQQALSCRTETSQLVFKCNHDDEKGNMRAATGVKRGTVVFSLVRHQTR
jgi:hypothetical protein